MCLFSGIKQNRIGEKRFEKIESKTAYRCSHFCAGEMQIK